MSLQRKELDLKTLQNVIYGSRKAHGGGCVNLKRLFFPLNNGVVWPKIGIWACVSTYGCPTFEWVPRYRGLNLSTMLISWSKGAFATFLLRNFRGYVVGDIYFLMFSTKKRKQNCQKLAKYLLVIKHGNWKSIYIYIDRWRCWWQNHLQMVVFQCFVW